MDVIQEMGSCSWGLNMPVERLMKSKWELVGVGGTGDTMMKQEERRVSSVR